LLYLNKERIKILSEKWQKGIMRPIISTKDSYVLQKAGLLIFDYTMNKDNQYMFHIPRLVEIANEILSSKQSKRGVLNE